MLTITRHGQTDWNSQGRIMGWCDEPLNNTGLQQAKETAALLKDHHFDLVICSPLLRARQTAEIILKDREVPVICDERIIERDFGEFDGLMKSEFNYADLWDYHKNCKYEKAENIQDFFRRIYAFLDDIRKQYPDKDILLVTHGGVSMPIECYFRGNIPEGTLGGKGISLKNCQFRDYIFTDEDK